MPLKERKWIPEAIKSWDNSSSFSKITAIIVLSIILAIMLIILAIIAVFSSKLHWIAQIIIAVSELHWIVQIILAGLICVVVLAGRFFTKPRKQRNFKVLRDNEEDVTHYGKSKERFEKDLKK